MNSLCIPEQRHAHAFALRCLRARGRRHDVPPFSCTEVALGTCLRERERRHDVPPFLYTEASCHYTRTEACTRTEARLPPFSCTEASCHCIRTEALWCLRAQRASVHMNGSVHYRCLRSVPPCKRTEPRLWCLRLTFPFHFSLLKFPLVSTALPKRNLSMNPNISYSLSILYGSKQNFRLCFDFPIGVDSATTIISTSLEKEFCRIGDDSCLVLWDARIGSAPIVKVGKGLSKDAEPQKLAFQHWIEAGHSSLSGQKQKFTSFRIYFRTGQKQKFSDDTQDPKEDVQQLGHAKYWIRSYHFDTIKLTDMLSNSPDISVVKTCYEIVSC
ncbi:unnamed protein product [Fraxinus pennsylvanica]|uniref:Uncharacterized protein n=1 Tax=Fraxinus pennsylvanica TaxID=56036 RepID=A0AAD1YL49_9LAMI|nr:unnamed protein product [Fraxinus pennsylvanica]